MSEPVKYLGRGTGTDRLEYLDFLNYVFGFNGVGDGDFLEFLPKLYKEQYHPCDNCFVIKEDGKLRAAVGVFPRDVKVGDETLSTYGIGNVAVHPRHRGRGFMKECMNAAIQDMIEKGADFSDLGGQRQRYQWFSYDQASATFIFNINATNLRHNFGNTPYQHVTFRRLSGEESDSELVDYCYELFCRKPSHVVRPREAFPDIARELYAIIDDTTGNCIGYQTGALNELTLADVSDFDRVIRSYVADYGSVHVHFAPWDTAFTKRAAQICDSYNVGHMLMVTVFHYAKFINAYLKLKASYCALPDGKMTVLVHGIAGDENVTIEVKNGIPTVDITTECPDYELSHLEAVSFFLSAYDSHRAGNPLAAVWFPLPVYIYCVDHV